METPTWLTELLEDPKVTDLCINGNSDLYFDRGLGLESKKTAGLWDEGTLRSWVLEQISAAGRSWDAKHPFVDGSLPSGHRLHVAFPPLARNGILISLRKLPKASQKSQEELLELARTRWSESPLFPQLLKIVASGDSILFSGATGSGKTTLMNDLLSQVTLQERIIALEDTPELAPSHPHFISMVSRPPNSDGFGEVTLRMLLKQTLRMRPDRIVLGECRAGEVLDLLQALNTGHHGSMATLHANSPRDALRRLELLCLLHGGGTIPLSALRDLIASGVQWVVQVVRTNNKRRIHSLIKIEGKEGDTLLMRPWEV